MSYYRRAVVALAATQGLVDFSKCDSFSQFRIEVKANQNKKIYSTATHRELHRGLTSQIDALTRNRYKDTNGPHSRLVQGPKGIGKSTILRSFLDQNHDKVLSLYLSYDELLQTDSVLKTTTVLQLIDQRLKEDGIHSSAFKSKNFGERLTKALEANDKYLFLVVDEIDQLYRESQQTKSVYDVARSNLGDLAWLGNQTSGRIAVFLCGSSASCPLLVTCNADKEEFPLQIGVPNLNGQRYRTLRLSVSLISNMKEMKSLLAEMGYESSEELARLMLFQVGLVPRAVHQHISCLLGGETQPFQNSLSQAHESGFKASSGLSGLLYSSLVKALRTKNAKTIEMLSDEVTGRLCEYKVGSVPWESEILPLNYEDVVACWKRVCYSYKEYSLESNNLQMLQHLIFGFCDQGKFSFGSIDRGLPRDLYPVCGAQVFLADIDMSFAQSFCYTVDLRIRAALELKVIDRCIDKYI